VRAPAINSYVLAERTRIFDLLVTKERYDQCPCPEDETDPDNSLIDISLGALSFRVDAKRSADRRNLRFKIGKKEFAFDLSNSPFQVELDLDELPPIVSELSGISGITVASLSDASGQQFHPFGNVFTVPPSSGFEGQAR
jgi:hypothetical protein